MNKNDLDTNYEDVELPYLDTFQRRDHDKGSRERSLPPLSPWTPTADPDGMLLETFEPQALDDASDDGRELSISVGINEHNEEVTSEYTPWEGESNQEEEHIGNDNALGHGILATCLVDSQYAWCDVHSVTSHDVPKSPSTCAASPHAARELVETLEEGGEQFPPERHVGLRKSTNDADLSKPSIIVSNTVCDKLAAGKLRALSESSSNIDLSMDEIDMKGDAAQHLYKTIAPLRRSTPREDLGTYGPNNYEIATQDRQPPHIPDGIDPRSKKIAAASLTVFCVDADLTTGDPVASKCTHMGPSHVKRRRILGNHHVLETPRESLSSLQHWQGTSRYPPTTSALQSHLQVPTYPTPPSSSKGLPLSQHLDSANDRYNTPASSQNSPIESWSPTSPSPSSLPEADDGSIRCRLCPNTQFAGPNQKNSLQRHIRDKHGGMPRLCCLIQECHVTFAPGRKDNQLKHVRAAHPNHPLPAPSTKRKRKDDSG